MSAPSGPHGLIFGEVAPRYDAVRPGYPPALAEAVVAYAAGLSAILRSRFGGEPQSAGRPRVIGILVPYPTALRPPAGHPPGARPPARLTGKSPRAWQHLTRRTR